MSHAGARVTAAHTTKCGCPTSYQFYGPVAIASDGTHVWVVSHGIGGGSVTELDAAAGTLVKVLAGPSYEFATPGAVASDGTHVWVANGGGSVTELDAAAGTLVKVLAGPSYEFATPGAVASDGTHVWVTNSSGDSVTEFPASSKQGIVGSA